MSEGIYRQVLDKYDYGKPSCRKSYNLVMALSFYGRMLQDSNAKRASEAADYIRVSDEISGKMPKWYDRLDNVKSSISIKGHLTS